MEEVKDKNQGKASEGQIKFWKEQYGSVFEYRSEDGKYGYLRAPSLDILDACRTISGGSSIRFDRALVENCRIGGDEQIVRDEQYLMGLFDWLGNIIKKVDGKLEEL